MFNFEVSYFFGFIEGSVKKKKKKSVKYLLNNRGNEYFNDKY